MVAEERGPAPTVEGRGPAPAAEERGLVPAGSVIFNLFLT